MKVVVKNEQNYVYRDQKNSSKLSLKKQKKEQLNNGLKNYLKNLLEIIQGTLSQQGKIKLAIT